MTHHKSIIVVGVLLVSIGIGGIACHRDTATHDGQSGPDGATPEISHYTCSMHPQIHEDKPGQCPICHMDLVPVYKEAPGAPLPNGKQGGESSFRISPERQQLIGVTTAVVEQRAVTKSIRTVGQVAYDPELAIAQREFLTIVRNAPALKSAAVSRLRLLGMSEEEIDALAHRQKTSSNLYLPASGETVWVYATLYQHELGLIRRGMTAAITLPSGSAQRFTGTVRTVDPVIDPATRSARARIEVPTAGGVLRPGTYVDVALQVELGEAMTIPQSSVIDTGARQIAFVVHEHEHFETRAIELGPEVDERVVVLSGLQAGEHVVASATFLVDSESQLKAAMSTGHQH